LYQALVILVFSLIGYGIYKRNKKIKEEKRMRANIDHIITKIEELRSKFSYTPQMLGSKSLTDKFNLCKKYFSQISIQKEYTKDLEDTVSNVYNSALGLFEDYNRKYSELSKLKSIVPGLTEAQSSIEKQINDANMISQKIRDYGYESTDINKSSIIAGLTPLISEIGSLIDIDIDKALSIYNRYTQSVSSINKKITDIKSNLSNIENAIKRINNWEKEVNSLMYKFNSTEGSKSTLNSMIGKFEAKLPSKDWFALCKELDEIISYMRKWIKKKEDDEAEERRRLQRIADDEAAARRRSEESSSSSSSSFSFGGGDSGGGGSSGSW
jgi:DNA repair exonuclease SbcCD ATPase subunit